MIVSRYRILCLMIFNKTFKKFHNSRVHGTQINKHMEEDKLTPSDISATVTHNGWIAPDGKFYECLDGGHYEKAKELIRVGNERPATELEIKTDTFSFCDAERLLEVRGWVKLCRGGGIRHAIRADIRFVKPQKEAIVNYCIANNLSAVKLWNDIIPIDEFLSDAY